MPLGIRKTGAQQKGLSLWRPYLERAQPASVTPFAGAVADDFGLGVVPQLHFEQDVATAGCIQSVSTVQHEAFTTDLEDFVEFYIKRFAISDLELLNGLQGKDLFPGDQAFVLFSCGPDQWRTTTRCHNLKDDVGSGDLLRGIGQLLGLGAAGHADGGGVEQ